MLIEPAQMRERLNAPFFVFVAIYLILAMSNCVSKTNKYDADKHKIGSEAPDIIEYFKYERSTKELKDYWIKSNTLYARTKVVRIFENRKDTDSLLFVSNDPSKKIWFLWCCVDAVPKRRLVQPISVKQVTHNGTMYTGRSIL